MRPAKSTSLSTLVLRDCSIANTACRNFCPNLFPCALLDHKTHTQRESRCTYVIGSSSAEPGRRWRHTAAQSTCPASVAYRNASCRCDLKNTSVMKMKRECRGERTHRSVDVNG
jgi:hypothetical protein